MNCYLILIFLPYSLDKSIIIYGFKQHRPSSIVIMALQKESRGTKDFKNLRKHFKDIEEYDLNDSNGIHQFSQNIVESTKSSIESIYDGSHQVTDEDIFGSSLYIDDDFCVEAVNTCRGPVLFKIGLNRKVYLPENHIKIVQGIDLPKEQMMIVQELINTEKTYLNKMEYIIKNYLQYFRDLDISSKIEKVFGNIEDIYCETKKMFYCMQDCASVDDIAKVFLSNISVFECYTKYFRNKMNLQQYPLSEFDDLLKQRQMQLGDLYTCESYLANPTQRPARYKLLLENLQTTLKKDCQSSRYLEKAIIAIDTKIIEANTLMAIDSIQYCSINLHKVGRFLMKDTFNVKRKYQSVIFLFEKCVVFCKENQSNPNLYEYIENIGMDELTLTHTNNSTRFQLGRYEKSKRYEDGTQYEFDIEQSLMTIKTKWVDEIKKILWNQLQYYREHSGKSSGVDDAKYKRQYDEILVSNAENHLNDIVLDREDTALSNGNQLCEGALRNQENVENTLCEGAPKNEEYSLQEGAFVNKDTVSYNENSLRNGGLGNKGTALCDKNSICESALRKEGIALHDEHFAMDKTHHHKNKIPRIDVFQSNPLESRENISKRIIQVLIEVEEVYLKEMANIIDKKEGLGTTNLPTYVKMLLKSIENIFSTTKLLRLKLLECDSIDDIAQVFLNNVYIFDSFTEYIRKNAIFCRYANSSIESGVKDNDQHIINSYSLSLILDTHEKHLEKLQAELMTIGQSFKLLDKAVKLVNDKITEAATLVAADSIENCPIHLQYMGPFIMKEFFKSKGKLRVVFLFKGIVLICSKDKAHPDTYTYFDCIEIQNLAITQNLKPRCFNLINSQKSQYEKKKCSFILEAHSEIVKKMWIRKIQTLLWKHVHHRRAVEYF